VVSGCPRLGGGINNFDLLPVETCTFYLPIEL